MPVNNNEHQRIDDVYTDLYILRYTVSSDNGFRIVTHELFDCFVQASQWPSIFRLRTSIYFTVLYHIASQAANKSMRLFDN